MKGWRKIRYGRYIEGTTGGGLSVAERRRPTIKQRSSNAFLFLFFFTGNLHRQTSLSRSYFKDKKVFGDEIIAPDYNRSNWISLSW